MTHEDDRIPERVLAEAKRYNLPPALSRSDLDDMWTRVESEALAAPPVAASPSRRGDAGQPSPLRFWLPLAAAMVLGVAIGRYTAAPRGGDAGTQQVASRPELRDSVSLDEPYQSRTSQYLGQAAALLVALPIEVRDSGGSEPYMGRAHDLLLTTRLLMDSPAAARDPRFRELLDDLELVFAQLVRLQSAQSSEELELIREALEQRDVLPRLRSAAANISAD